MKYILTNDTIEVDGHILHRIVSLNDFNDVKAGELGGYIENESNLSQYGDCWVYTYAKVYGNAWVYGNAKVYGSTKVYGNAWVFGEARVYGKAEVYGKVKVYGNAWIYDDAKVYGNSGVCGDAKVFGKAKVFGNALVFGHAKVYENASVYGEVVVGGDVKICEGEYDGKNRKTYRELFENEKTSFPKVMEIFNESGFDDFNEFLNSTVDKA